MSSSSNAEKQELNDMVDRLVNLMMGLQAELEDIRARIKTVEEACEIRARRYH